MNSVGVDLNTASASLLKYVAGINQRVADNIIKYRESNHKFVCREDLKKVAGLGANTFLQSAGFLRITEGNYFLDSTAVHPESYQAAQKILDHYHLTMKEIQSSTSLLKDIIKSADESIQDLAMLCGCGPETLSDILECFEKPGVSV